MPKSAETDIRIPLFLSTYTKEGCQVLDAPFPSGQAPLSQSAQFVFLPSDLMYQVSSHHLAQQSTISHWGDVSWYEWQLTMWHFV